MLSTILAILPWLLLVVWCAWWLWCVNWQDAWPILARGGWVVVVLFVLVGALAWAAVLPSRGPWEKQGVPLPNFWWQLGGTTLLALLALLCGWVQGRLGWAPPPVTFEPAVLTQAHGHGEHEEPPPGHDEVGHHDDHDEHH